MANYRNRNRPAPSERVRDHGQRRIIWKGTLPKGAYANVINVVGGREEIFLLFGLNQSWHAALPEIRVALAERVIMSPFVAKRLAAVLTRLVGEYERRYGPLELAPAAPPLPRRPLPRDPVEEKADLLLDMMKQLDLELGYERSFKCLEKTLIDNRFLLGASKEAVRREPEVILLNICEQLGMPGEFRDTFRENLSQARYVHFGFEEFRKRVTYKAYLEFGPEPGRQAPDPRDSSEPFLIHLALAWDTGKDGRKALGRSICYPRLTREAILERLSAVLDPRRHPRPFEMVGAVIDAAAARTGASDLSYMEVTEEGTPRRSFDINLYNARMPFGDMVPVLEGIRDHYALPSERFKALSERIRNKTISHLAGGIDGEGRDFLSLHYGLQALLLP